MQISLCLAIALLCCLPGSVAVAQDQPGGAGRTVLASGHLDSVTALPLFFRLYRARLPAGQHASYQGASAMLYDLSGTSTIAIDGGAARPPAEGAGVFIAAGPAMAHTGAHSPPPEP